MYRKIFAVLCALYLLLSGTAGEAAVFGAVESEVMKPSVVSADFYPSGAKFVFQVTPDSSGGFNFTLPGVFAHETVRPLVRGTAFMWAETVQAKPEPFPELEPLEKKIEERRREVRLCEARVNANSQALSMLRAAAASFDVSEIAGYIDSAVDKASEKRLRYELALVDLTAEREKAEKELREAEEELRLLRAELESKAPDRAQAVRVNGTADGPVLFEAYAYDAGWTARYDINLDSGTGQVDAVMFANVRQRTGFDLDGEFSFHTRAPSFSIEPPNLPPLPVRLAMPPRPMANMAMKEMSAAGEEVYAAADMALPAPRQQAPELWSALANVSVKGDGKIKGDGVAADVLLGRFEFKSTPLLVAIPEQSREAWVVASLDVIPESLLPGAAELYVDRAVSGKTRIPELGLQGTLPFGMAQRVTAEKKREVGKTGSTWLGKGTLRDGYTIEVVNNMDTEREIEVRDRLPLPADEKITIEDVKLDPAPELQEKDNRLTWRLKLKPGETGKISVEYTLRYPGDEELVYW